MIEKTSKDFLIPREMRKEIEQDYLKYIRTNNPKVVLSDEEVLSRIPRDFLNVHMKFRSSAKGVLTRHTQYNVPRGGGEIDLGRIVKGSKGSFFLTVDAVRSEDPEKELDNLDIYFVSNTKQKKIGKDNFGIGCKKYLNITGLMKTANESGGLHLNATEQRYVPVIGGVFYFVNFSSERKIYIAAVRVHDSRFPDMFCEESI